MNKKESVNYISSIIGNRYLSESIYESIFLAVKNPDVLLDYKSTVINVFNRFLDNSIRDIENHEKGKLFKRLIEYGGLSFNDKSLSDFPPKTVLGDEEFVSAVNFIYSFIINRFKGDLAEILAIESCKRLLKELQLKSSLSENAKIAFGDYIKEYQKTGILAKGADGLFIDMDNSNNSVVVKGVIEIKSMPIPVSKILKQIQNHITRLEKGVSLGLKEFNSEKVICNPQDVIKIIVVPSTWKVNRHFTWLNENGIRKMSFPEPDKPQNDSKIEEFGKNIYKIILKWSKEALEQAAYEMTFNYMSAVGISVFENKPLPKGLEDMPLDKIGYNSIIEKIYHNMQPYHFEDIQKNLSRQQKIEKIRMIKLFNVYSFGYPLGIDSKQMLWAEDLI
jgi:hypothetical protein